MCHSEMSKSHIGIETRVFGWRHAPEAWAEIWEKAVSWVSASEEEGWISELNEARRLCALWSPRVGWVESWRCKSSQHRKIVSLSPHVEKPFNSRRWIKVSYLSQFREFRVFRFPMSILHIRIFGYVIVSQIIVSANLNEILKLLRIRWLVNKYKNAITKF